MNEGSKSVLLKEMLTFYLNGKVHTSLDLGFRKVLSTHGSLCGMAALYRAAADTIFTVFELKNMAYDDLKASLIIEIGQDPDANRLQADELLLENYYSSMYMHVLF